MTKYELVNNNIEVVVALVKNDLTSANVIRDIEMFETFHNLQGTKYERYKVLSEKFNMSEVRVRQIITDLTKKIK